MAAAKPKKTPASSAPKAPKQHKKPTRRSAPAPVDLEVDPDVLEFIAAVDEYRRTFQRPFPGWSEVLAVLKQLGYRKSAPANAPVAHSHSSSAPNSKR